MVELAIFGSLALLALAVLIQMGLRQNFQQDVEQDAFRRAQFVAQAEGDEEESQAVQYNFFRNRRIPNPSDGYAVTTRMLAQGSGTVTWGQWLTYIDGSRDGEPRIIVNLDDQGLVDARSSDFPDDQPLVSAVDKLVDGTSQIEQTNQYTRRTSHAHEDIGLTLSNGATVYSGMDTDISHTWLP
jgi:hypothetical protein